MNKRSGRKKIRDITRKVNIKRVNMNSYHSEPIEISKPYLKKPKDIQAYKKKVKNPDVKSKKPINPVLGDFSREKISKLELKKTFYTPPRRQNSGNSARQNFFYFLKKNKIFLGHFARIFFTGLALMLFFNAHGGTSIEIKPRLQYESIDDLITVYKNPKESQLGFDIIAVTDELSLSVIAGENEVVSEYARGEVTIFNNFSSEPQRLLPETRFKSAGGQIFLLLGGGIIVPGRDESGPGKIDATVLAYEPGEKYNIGVTDFTLPGYQDLGLEDKYNNIYAVSKASFVGGFIGTRAVIGSLQLEQSQEKLKQQLNERLLLRLKKEKTEQVFLVNNTAVINYQQPKIIYSDDRETAIMTTRGTIISGVISKNKLRQHLNRNTQYTKTATPTQIVNIDKLKISNKISTDISDSEVVQMDINIHGDILLETEINQQKIITDLSGMKKNELISYFKNTGIVDTAQIDIRPFWRSKVHETIKEVVVSNHKLD